MKRVSVAERFSVPASFIGIDKDSSSASRRAGNAASRAIDNKANAGAKVSTIYRLINKRMKLNIGAHKRSCRGDIVKCGDAHHGCHQQTYPAEELAGRDLISKKGPGQYQLMHN